MDEWENETILGRGGIGLEAGIIALLSPFVFAIGFNTNYGLLYQVALILLILILLLRIGASQANDPNLSLIKESIIFGARLSHIAIIGAIVALSISIDNHIEYRLAEVLFVGIAISISVAVGVVDQLVLGEYVDTWETIIHNQTGEHFVGEFLRNTIEFSGRNTEMAMIGESSLELRDYIKAALIGSILLVSLLVVTLPITYLLSNIFGSIILAFLIFLSIIVLRDIPRYTYVRYGASPPFSELKSSTKKEFLWIVGLSVILAGSLGHNLVLWA